MANEIPDYYTGFTQVEVEGMLVLYKSELQKVIVQYSTSGDAVTRMRRDDLRLELRGVQRALRKFDPETYGSRVRTVTSRSIGIMYK